MRWDWWIWIVNALLQWTLLVIVLGKNRWRQHPAFAIYVAFCCCKTSLLIWVVQFERPLYFSINWGTRLIVLPLMIAVLIEVFARVFRPYSTLPKGTVRWFRIALALLVLITTALAVLCPGPGRGSIINLVMVLNRSASIIFCGAFGFTALFLPILGFPGKPARMASAWDSCSSCPWISSPPAWAQLMALKFFSRSTWLPCWGTPWP